ncbi:unnamed protein product [Nezara viridula]|uniref:Uncharacterized protein n=1 Tax=Nezara viridula TaxID=85310 RepID=A0A9P0EIC0_NEZVI|nr:unnamed protein product [Nezara viridula]
MTRHKKSSNKQDEDDDWSELLKVMGATLKPNIKCQVKTPSYDSLNNNSFENRPSNNYDNRASNNYDNRTSNSYHEDKHSKAWCKEKRTDDAVCVAKLRRMFASCCAENNLSSRVNDLEFKVRRLEKIYCKKVKKQLEELSGKKGELHTSKYHAKSIDHVKSTESINKSKDSSEESGSLKRGGTRNNRSVFAEDREKRKGQSAEQRRKTGGEQRRTTGVEQRKTSATSGTSGGSGGSGEQRRGPSGEQRKTTQAEQKRSSGGERRRTTTSSRRNYVDSDHEQRRPSTSVNRVVFKRENSRFSDDAFSEDTSELNRRENYFFVATSPHYFDKDQIPVKDITCPTQVKNAFLRSKSGIGFDAIQKKNQWLESMSHLQRTTPDLMCLYKYLCNDELKKHRSLKNSFDYGELEKPSKNLKISFDDEEAEKPSGSTDEAFVEYTSILKQTKDINPVAANIATFNNASKVSNLQANVTESITQQIGESIITQTKEHEFEENNVNETSINLLSSEKSMDAVEKINRSVSTCKLPIDINLYLLPKLSKLDPNVEGKRNGNISDVESCRFHSNNLLGVSRAVCFDTPSTCSSSQISIKFTSLTHRRSCSN